MAKLFFVCKTWFFLFYLRISTTALGNNDLDLYKTEDTYPSNYNSLVFNFLDVSHNIEKRDVISLAINNIPADVFHDTEDPSVTLEAVTYAPIKKTDNNISLPIFQKNFGENETELWKSSQSTTAPPLINNLSLPISTNINANTTGNAKLLKDTDDEKHITKVGGERKFNEVVTGHNMENIQTVTHASIKKTDSNDSLPILQNNLGGKEADLWKGNQSTTAPPLINNLSLPITTNKNAITTGNAKLLKDSYHLKEDAKKNTIVGGERKFNETVTDHNMEHIETVTHASIQKSDSNVSLPILQNNLGGKETDLWKGNPSTTAPPVINNLSSPISTNINANTTGNADILKDTDHLKEGAKKITILGGERIFNETVTGQNMENFQTVTHSSIQKTDSNVSLPILQNNVDGKETDLWKGNPSTTAPSIINNLSTPISTNINTTGNAKLLKNIDHLKKDDKNITVTSGAQKNETLNNHNMENFKTDFSLFYNTTIFKKANIGNFYWVDMIQRDDVKVNVLLSNSHRRAVTVKLSFDFPFYGSIIKNVTITTGGYISTGDFIHSLLSASQYIAPLMANFDTSLSNYSFIKYVDNGTAFTVEWEKVVLQDNPKSGEFTFQVTLFNNGDIVFVYKTVPLLIDQIDDQSHPVKVGLSDAYVIDRQVYGIRRRTMYEYNRININKKYIENQTTVFWKALSTCLDAQDCETCLTRKIECGWCPALGKCSQGVDRNRQSWVNHGCQSTFLRNVSRCHDMSKIFQFQKPLDLFKKNPIA